MCFLNVLVVLLRNVSVLYEPSWCLDREGSFLITNTIAKAAGISFSWSFVGSKFKSCDFGVQPLVFVGLLELAMLGAFVLSTIWLILLSLLHCDRVNKWHSVKHLFWKVLPQLRSFSALWALHFVTPAILATAASELLSQLKSAKRPKRMLLRFLAERLFFGIVGVDAFLIKVRDVKSAARMTCSLDPQKECENKFDLAGCTRDVNRQCGTEFLWDLVTLLVFLNQTLGIVQVAHVVQHRLNVFIFGGEKASLSNHDVAKKRTYQAMLAWKVWQESTFFQFLAIMLSWTDYDMQALFWDHHRTPEDSRTDSMTSSLVSSASSQSDFGPPPLETLDQQIVSPSRIASPAQASSFFIPHTQGDCFSLAEATDLECCGAIAVEPRVAEDGSPLSQATSMHVLTCSCGNCASIIEHAQILPLMDSEDLMLDKSVMRRLSVTTV